MRRSRLFVLWHHFWRDGAKLYVLVLLSYRHIKCVAYLVAKVGLLDCPYAGGDHEWPEDWGSYQADCSDDCFVYPLLVANHGEYSAWRTLHCDG